MSRCCSDQCHALYSAVCSTTRLSGLLLLRCGAVVLPSAGCVVARWPRPVAYIAGAISCLSRGGSVCLLGGGPTAGPSVLPLRRCLLVPSLYRLVHCSALGCVAVPSGCVPIVFLFCCHPFGPVLLHLLSLLERPASSSVARALFSSSYFPVRCAPPIGLSSSRLSLFWGLRAHDRPTCRAHGMNACCFSAQSVFWTFHHCGARNLYLHYHDDAAEGCRSVFHGVMSVTVLLHSRPRTVGMGPPARVYCVCHHPPVQLVLAASDCSGDIAGPSPQAKVS